jgi:hypothetical protein
MNTYTAVWNKYRPAILKMMIESSATPQQYQMSQHEFKALSPRQKGGYTFQLKVANSRAVSGLKDSMVAQDLWEVLKMSPKASTMIDEGSFEFAMDKQFILHVSRNSENN